MIEVRGSTTWIVPNVDGTFAHRLDPPEDGTMLVVEAVDRAGNIARLVVTVRLTEDVPSASLLGSPLVVGGACLGLAAFVGIAVGVETVRFSALLVLVPLYARVRRKKVLDNRARYLLHGIIIDNPGIHYRALLRELELSNGIAVYHLDVLEREGFIRSVRDGRFRRFYSMDVKVPLEHRPSTEQLCDRLTRLVTERSGISQKEIIEETGLSRRTVGYHLNALVSRGALVASRQGRNTVYTVRTKKRRTRTKGTSASTVAIGRGSKG
jgi:predicted transcriptional regulator